MRGSELHPDDSIGGALQDQVLTQNSQAKVDRDDDHVPEAGQHGAVITGSRIPLERLAVYEH